MTIYVAKILVEKPVGHSACKVKLASDLEEIKDYAEDAATAYANLYEGTIKIHSDKKYLIEGEYADVTITIEAHRL